MCAPGSDDCKPRVRRIQWPRAGPAHPVMAVNEEFVSRNFKSDNVTPACDAIMAAVQAANAGSVASYGGDGYTLELQKVASRVFDT
jgi:threonine aldolase